MQANGIDPSTGFLDRNSCLELVSRLASSAAASGQQLAALWIDLSRLKQVNESFGHLGGDPVITRIALRLREKSAGRGEWSLLAGARYARHLDDAGYRTKVAINVSRAQLASPQFAQALHGALLCANVRPELIELELTESLFMDICSCPSHA